MLAKSGDGGNDDGGVSTRCELCVCDDDDCVPVPLDDAFDETELLRSTSAAGEAVRLGTADGLAGVGVSGRTGVSGWTSMVGTG